MLGTILYALFVFPLTPVSVVVGGLNYAVLSNEFGGGRYSDMCVGVNKVFGTELVYDADQEACVPNATDYILGQRN